MNQKKSQFSSTIGFVFAAAGSAVGVGNIWGFPTQVATNGGGAFLFLYLLMTVFIAYPMLLTELTVGRHGQSGPIKSLKKLSSNNRQKTIASLFGIMSILVVTLILTFYSIISGWFLAFSLEPIFSFLPNSKLGPWLTDFSLSRNLIFTYIFLAFTVVIVKKGVQDGIEKWCKYLMPLLFLILISLSIYILTLKGAGEGLKHYLVPDFKKIWNPEILISAMGQSFFSLSLGAGVMIVYGSYLSSKDSLKKLALQVTILDTSVALLAGLLVIPAMYAAQHNGIQIFDSSGKLIDSDQLVFSVLPSLFNSMGQIRGIISLLFFALMTIAALTSTVSMLEVPVNSLIENMQLSRSRSITFTFLFCCIFSTLIIFNFEVFFSWLIRICTQYGQPISSLGVTLCAGWFWNRANLLKELNKNQNTESSWFQKYLPLYLKLICPIFIILVIFFT